MKKKPINFTWIYFDQKFVFIMEFDKNIMLFFVIWTFDVQKEYLFSFRSVCRSIFICLFHALMRIMKFVRSGNLGGGRKKSNRLICALCFVMRNLFFFEMKIYLNCKHEHSNWKYRIDDESHGFVFFNK